MLLKQSRLDVVPETKSIRTVVLHDVVSESWRLSALTLRCDRGGPHSIVADNVSSDSIPGVLGIVTLVESTFGGCLSCSCSECVDAFSASLSLCCIHQLALLSLSWWGNDYGELVPSLFWPRKTLVWAFLLPPHRSIVKTCCGAGFEVHFFPFYELSKRG